MTNDSISALVLNTAGSHQFVVYGDSCSGVPGAIHEETTSAVNAVVAGLRPLPEFIAFLGDEVIGLTTDESALREQWRFWFDHEMAWLDRDAISMYNVPANHTTYDRMSESVYAEVMSHLPANGPAGQQHLSYFVVCGNMLLVFVNTMWTELGEGRMETEWLDRVLTDHAEVPIKLVFGHHPVFPINGFSAAYQREIEPENGQAFWDILVRHHVRAYFSSHMLAFDVQIHRGVLQVMTAGAGTKHRMPEGIEYLHAVQVALDEGELRYQVLDDTGIVRESLTWPVPEIEEQPRSPVSTEIIAQTIRILDINGAAAESGGTAQTLISYWNDDPWLPPLWIGLIGPEQRLSALLAPQTGRSPHLWTGPRLDPGQPFAIQLMLHPGMGPGGLLWRWSDTDPWTSMTGASAWGLEPIPAVSSVTLAHASSDADDRPFRGRDLIVRERTRTRD